MCLYWYFESTYVPSYGEGPDSLANWSILHLGLLIGLVLTVFQPHCHFQPDDLVLQGVIEAASEGGKRSFVFGTLEIETIVILRVQELWLESNVRGWVAGRLAGSLSG